MNKIIYAITGQKRHGKDTLAKFIIDYDNRFKIISFADDLKKMAIQIFNLTHDQLYNQDLKEEPFDYPVYMDSFISKMSEETGLSIKPQKLIAKDPRDIITQFGTEYVRSIDDDYWINKWEENIYNYDRVICSDLRFKREDLKISELNGIKIRVIKDNFKINPNFHRSEVEQINIEPDHTVMNIFGKPDILREFAYRLLNDTW